MTRPIQVIILSVVAALTTIIVFDKSSKKSVGPPPQRQQIIVNELIVPPVQPEPIKPRIPVYPQPSFVDLSPLQQTSNLGRYLSDIESHLQAGHQYRDRDRVTWAHETTHGINSRIRNTLGSGTTRSNGVYVLSSKAVVLQEPRIKLRTVAQAVPQSLRGNVYNLYLVKQAASWDDCPLYVLDEWSAYTNGTLVGMELGLNRGESAQYMMEFMAYSFAMVAASGDSGEITTFVRWYAERVMWIYNQIQSGKYPSMRSGGMENYFRKFQTAPDAENLRSFIRQHFKAEWSKRVLGI